MCGALEGVPICTRTLEMRLSPRAFLSLKQLWSDEGHLLIAKI